VSNNKNNGDENEPENEQGGRQAALKDAHDGPAEEQEPDNEQKYPDIPFHRAL
jgi:hypothetical protein